MKANDILHGQVMTALQDAITEMADTEQQMEDEIEAGKAIHPATRNRFYFLKGKVTGLEETLDMMR
jgi:hypothetical protein